MLATLHNGGSLPCPVHADHIDGETPLLCGDLYIVSVTWTAKLFLLICLCIKDAQYLSSVEAIQLGHVNNKKAQICAPH